MDKKTISGTKSILIKKASGEEEIFSAEKLEQSLINAGATKETIAKIVSNIEDWIVPGITTKKIYSRAYSILWKEKTSTSIRYKLKQAILELGPTGYPFERLIGEIFKRKGYSTEVGVIVKGQCITHEMDVIATNDSMQHLIECKYHKDQGSHVSIQVPLYVRARVDDIISTREKMPEYKNTSFLGWVITNTRFSTDSIEYSKCSGLNLLAWDFPQGEGLKDIIETLKIYPITILNTLQLKEKRYLLDKGITTCKELLSQPELLSYFNFNTKKHASVIQELINICD